MDTKIFIDVVSQFADGFIDLFKEKYPKEMREVAMLKSNGLK